MKHIILTIAVSLFTVLPVAAQMYRWVDGKGQVHYSSEPPQGQKAEQIKKPTSPRVNNKDVVEKYADGEKKPTEAEKQESFNRAAQQQAQKDEAQTRLACDGMRKDLALYQNYPRARVDVEGTTRRLTSEELNTRIADLQKNINDNCQGY
ncbi:DUF4124 domain-containing protein [Entomomonas sp. E2T0]|uniref:DUF4124 domain-containing protein n=1 Tax=Entomomonas sp. E2T0 TaxID=2930213 RepID=UPI0022284960|nr:DUF4124 domain-containing protein [Entomomonas sp. E2T0]UYZ84499.1 DUF4124 domain-containing protein [Entomomonas sp. E2T0]